MNLPCQLLHRIYTYFTHSDVTIDAFPDLFILDSSVALLRFSLMLSNREKERQALRLTSFPLKRRSANRSVHMGTRRRGIACESHVCQPGFLLCCRDEA